MQQQTATHPGAVSTVRHRTAEQINEGTIECHLLFFHELSGGKGHGEVPREDAARKRYFAGVRRVLKKEYGISDGELAGLVSAYRESNGPIIVRRELVKRRPQKVQMQ